MMDYYNIYITLLHNSDMDTRLSVCETTTPELVSGFIWILHRTRTHTEGYHGRHYTPHDQNTTWSHRNSYCCIGSGTTRRGRGHVWPLNKNLDGVHW